MAATEVIEGFLCPICVQDLGSVAQLQDHFELAHANEDRALINQLKGLFGKAKRKLLGQDVETSDAFGLPSGDSSSTIVGKSISSSAVSGIDPTLWEPQELGVTRSVTDVFKSVRGSRIDHYVIETNKLLIRLDKLVNIDVNMDPGKRKAFEKSLVLWAPDADVVQCISCGNKFKLTRRRHHCRLCGCIICNKCSHFLPFDFAKKLTNPAFSYEGEGFRRSGSNSSLNSVFSPEGDVHIRTCNQCRMLLERRDEQMSQKAVRPVIVLLYERMHDYMSEAEKNLPEYLQMANSLNAGDLTYSLVEAQELRLRLTKLYENIGSLAKRVSVLGMDNPEPPTPKVLRLQQMIAAHASAFLQDNLLGLPPLPSEAELTRRHEAKRAEAQRRIAEERRQALEQRRRREEAESQLQQSTPKESVTSRTKASPEVKYSAAAVEISTGWKPDETRSGMRVAGAKGDDPMLQQMNIIRSYIKQAQEARRWDEVQMLEENLKELQQEYYAQHNT